MKGELFAADGAPPSGKIWEGSLPSVCYMFELIISFEADVIIFPLYK